MVCHLIKIMWPSHDEEAIFAFLEFCIPALYRSSCNSWLNFERRLGGGLLFYRDFVLWQHVTLSSLVYFEASIMLEWLTLPNVSTFDECSQVQITRDNRDIQQKIWYLPGELQNTHTCQHCLYNVQTFCVLRPTWLTRMNRKLSAWNPPCHWHEDVGQQKPPVPVACIGEDCH